MTAQHVQRLNDCIARHPAGKAIPARDARLAGVVLGLDLSTPLCGVCGGTDCDHFRSQDRRRCAHVRTDDVGFGEARCHNCGLVFRVES